LTANRGSELTQLLTVGNWLICCPHNLCTVLCIKNINLLYRSKWLFVWMSLCGFPFLL